jgi:hypothetical protein
MKLDIKRSLKEGKKNIQKLPESVREIGEKRLIEEVELWCKESIIIETGPMAGTTVTYVNCPNPFLKVTKDEILIRCLYLYILSKNPNPEYIKKLMEEIQDRGHIFIERI